jgi:hypothetical protein
MIKPWKIMRTEVGQGQGLKVRTRELSRSRVIYKPADQSGLHDLSEYLTILNQRLNRERVCN